MLGSYPVSAQLVASRVALSSTELVSLFYVEESRNFPLHFVTYPPLWEGKKVLQDFV
jgi:hypothetical protein